jgi:predicted phosphodiesterase
MTNKLGWSIFILILAGVIITILELCRGEPFTEKTPLTFSSPLTSEAVNYPYSFAVTGDTHGGYPQRIVKWIGRDYVRGLIIQKIAEFKPMFVISTGDLVRTGSKPAEWQDFDRLNSIFVTLHIPYYPILGNHDYLTDKTIALEQYFTRFPQLNHQRWYTITRGNACFILLDANSRQLSPDEWDQQQKWLVEMLNKSETDSGISFIFVFFHQPPFTNSKDHKPNEYIQAQWVPLFQKSTKVKMVFSGHFHSYERFKINGINYIVSGGGCTPLMEEYAFDPKDWRYHNEYAPDKPHGQHFSLLTIYPDKILFKTLHLNCDRKTWQEGDFLEVK